MTKTNDALFDTQRTHFVQREKMQIAKAVVTTPDLKPGTLDDWRKRFARITEIPPAVLNNVTRKNYRRLFLDLDRGDLLVSKRKPRSTRSDVAIVAAFVLFLANGVRPTGQLRRDLERVAGISSKRTGGDDA